MEDSLEVGLRGSPTADSECQCSLRFTIYRLRVSMQCEVPQLQTQCPCSVTSSLEQQYGILC